MTSSGRRFLYCFVVFSFGVLSYQAAKLPKDWIRCNLKKPDANECLRVAVEDAIVKLKDGSSELSFSPLEPLLIPSMTIGAGVGPVNVVQHFDDVKLHGLTGSKVLSASVDLDNNSLLANSITPMLRLEAQYKMNGRVLLIPIIGDGPCNVTLINTAINHTLHGERMQKRVEIFYVSKIIQ
ncbi:hypothetical protein HHI36_022057 [Cryptolaemus montrouzieri]|uniref:Uncharacterized protein n=1 Tax=Cryptolaemus montrouzieri TaxID=559131 RepID=A0ABD2MZD6_9CUCU